MATVTSPILTDATFATKMDALAAAVKPDASDIPLTPPSGMTATNVQDGFSEIKQSLVDLKTSTFLGRTQSKIDTSAQTVSLSENFNDYLLINIEFRESSNILATLTLLSEYINITTSTASAQLYVGQQSGYVKVYKNADTSLKVEGSKAFGSSYNVAIRGIIKK